MSGAVAEVVEDDALALAESAHALVQSDAAAAAQRGERALRIARERGEVEAELAALHALSFARHELGDPRSLRTARAAVRIGERHGLEWRTALVRRRLALDLATRGAARAALRELEIACGSLEGLELARSEVFRLGVLVISGRTTESSLGTDRALETLRREGDTIWEARLLRNRGTLQAERGDLAAAESDLIRARDLYAELGATEAAFSADVQLTRIELARGDLPACLARLDAIGGGDISPWNGAELESLRAKALAAGRLRSEALHALALAEKIWRRSRIDDYEGRLEAVRLTLLAGDPVTARALAREAQRSFVAHGRQVHGSLAAALGLAAAIAAGAVRPSTLRSGRRAARTLADAGWPEESRRAQLLVARAAIELGSPRMASRAFNGCSVLLRRGRVPDRIEAWHVEALLRLERGDRAGAQRALRTGLGLLEGYRETLGASDLRASASEIGVELAELGLRIALAGVDTGSMLAWADRLRASALRLAPVTPPNAPELRDRTAELRQVSAEIWRAERAQRATRTLFARQAELEASIRRVSRHAAGAAAAPAGAPPDRRELSTALGGAALVELIELDDALIALTLAGGRLARHELGPATPVKEELEWLRFALVRLMRRRLGAAQRATMRRGARASAQCLGERLIAPLADSLGDRSLVIVPTGSLHATPWAMLPELRGRPVVVAPSAATWLALQDTRAEGRKKIALVAGPRLRHVRAELAAVGALYPRAVTLIGRQATVDAAMEALDGATVAHLACHGHFRSDSPLFSSLELADGPLNAYELQRLRRPPQLIVLSACDLGTSETRPGDELLGIAAALIAMGTRTIIASVVPVPDAGAKRLMASLHGHLTAGDAPSVALAKAQAGMMGGPPAPAAVPGPPAQAGFVCLGAG
ncbi:MAG TPA: CHAT domain-containing protein [Solirubrobacteraceae bacterium]|nr:CHAT domain-containing protein [Solirubrobacteraceae bacterium]